MSNHSIAEQPGALPLDSTQTIRAVTVSELRDSNQQKWFAVQLAVSDRPVNLDTLPRFDVFATYRLYAIQGRLGANPCYALRLGFFTEQESARTICADLKAFYRSASVVQVSAAEQVRFERASSQEVPVQKPAPTAAAVVDISSVRRNATGPSTVAPAPTSAAAIPKASVNAITHKSAAPPRKAATVIQSRTKFKSLSQELLEEARQIELAKTGRHNMKPQNASWLSRWWGRSNE